MEVFIVLRRCLHGVETKSSVQAVYADRNAANRHAKHSNYSASAFKYWVVKKEVIE